MKSPFFFRYATYNDRHVIGMIDQKTHAFPLDEAAIIRMARKKNSLIQVATTRTDPPCVVGFIAYELQKRRLLITRMGVMPHVGHHRVGTGLIEMMKNKVNDKRKMLCVAVRESCLDSHLFLRAMGFRARKVARRLYKNNGEDGYVFTWAKPSMVPSIKEKS